MSRYFGQINFVLSASNEVEAEALQQMIRNDVSTRHEQIVDVFADEPVERAFEWEISPESTEELEIDIVEPND